MTPKESYLATAQKLGVELIGLIETMFDAGRQDARAELVALLNGSAHPVVDQRKSITVNPAKAAKIKPVSPIRMRALQQQGTYMGLVRQLSPRKRAQVKKMKAANGYPAAIALAKKLR